MDVSVKLVAEHKDILARVLEIRHRRGVVWTPAYAVNATHIDGEILSKKDLGGIAEIHMVFTLEKIANLSNKLALQNRFESRINSYIRRIPDNHLVFAVPIIEGKLSDNKDAASIMSHVSFITELVANPRMDIICLPIFYRFPEDLMPKFIYMFLDHISSYKKAIAVSIPYASRETREKIFGIYMRWMDRNNNAINNIMCIDYNGSNPIRKYVLHNYVIGYLSLLEKEFETPIALYGINVKYSSVERKHDEVPAFDLASYFANLDIYGENHKRKTIPGEVAKRMKAAESINKKKLLNRSRYTYVSIEKMNKEPDSAIQEIFLINKLLNNASRQRIEKIIKQINARNRIQEALSLKIMFEKNSDNDLPLQYLSAKKIASIDKNLIPRLKKFANLYKTKTLDKYMAITIK